jgi:MSHA biogenesis protein MshL
MLLSACASAPGKKEVSALDQMINDAFQNNQIATAVPTESSISDNEIANALLPDINLSAPGAGSIDVEPRFDIKVHRASVRQFFMGLVEDSNYNMILHPKVRGRITLDLKNVNVIEVLKVVRDIYGYDFEQSNTTFSVFPNTIRTRIFTMN